MRYLEPRKPRLQERNSGLIEAYGREGTRLRFDGGASMRMIAAMAELRPGGSGPLPANRQAAARLNPFEREAVESDAQYFRRRRAEELRAADQAAGPEAYAAHQELAGRYARLFDRTKPRGSSASRHDMTQERVRLTSLLGRRFGLSGRIPAQDKELTQPQT